MLSSLPVVGASEPELPGDAETFTLADRMLLKRYSAKFADGRDSGADHRDESWRLTSSHFADISRAKRADGSEQENSSRHAADDSFAIRADGLTQESGSRHVAEVPHVWKSEARSFFRKILLIR